MPWRAITLVALLAMGGCTQQAPKTQTPDDTVDNPAVPASGYLPPADRPGYIDATDPNAFPPTPEQPRNGE